MKKSFTIFYLLIFTSILFPQSKYLIYFRDKGVPPNTKLMKTSALFEAASKELSSRAIERRKQVMGEDNYITYEDLPVSENYINQVKTLGIKIDNKLKWLNAVSCYLTGGQLSKVKQIPSVLKVEPVKRITSSIPNNESIVEPESKSQLKKINSLDYGPSIVQNELSEIPAVHDLGIDGSGVIIGILDTGFRWKVTSSIKNKNVVAEYDFIQNDSITGNQTEDYFRQDNHGTAVFSIIGGYSPDSLIGPAYNASYILAKTENYLPETHAEEDDYAAAIEWMEGLGADITTSSLGYSEFDDSVYSYTYEDMNGNTTIVAKAANLMFDRGVSTFTAAGNDGDKIWHYISSPADAFNIITVGSVTKNNVLSAFSSHGPSYDGRIKPEITAMGSGVYHANAGSSDFNYGDGTSYATPIAAGIAGLLKSAFQHLTNTQIRKIFLESSDNTASPNNDIGYGLISAKKAITYPNLSLADNQFTLHKIFINDSGIEPSSSTLYYNINNSGFQSTPMNYDGSLKYTFTFASVLQGQPVEFYFTYNNSSGAQVREPAGTLNYKFSYGSNQVSLITDAAKNQDLPISFSLFQNYPNPFNPSTTIAYTIPNVGTGHAPSLQHVTLKVYDILGREVATLVNEFQNAGQYKVTFDGRQTIGNKQLTSGVYFYKLEADNFIAIKKMMLIK